jgi:predicted TIM-barrel fold metal-dependent hydrolase
MSRHGVASLQNPIMQGLKVSGERSPQAPIGLRLPEGQLVVSADSHWEVSEDIFHDRFPSRLKDKAPRVWFNRFWHIGYRDGREAYGPGAALSEALERCTPSGVWDSALREEHLKIEGIQKEIVFPQSLIGFARYADPEIQEWTYRTYNEYIAERSAGSNGRFYGVGICSNWWDPSKAASAIRELVALGLRTFLLPVSPGKNFAGKEISYADPEMNPLWEAIVESGLPINFHIGENAFIQDGPGGIGAYELVALAPFRKPFGQLVFGGVFDRHPKLKVVFTEGGISWIAPALQDAEMIFDTFADLAGPLRQRPSYYWRQNCFATFQNDPLGLEQLDYIGEDRVMWASDYPHTEGSFGYTWSSMKAVLEAAASPETSKKILGDTATDLYRLD